MSYGLKAKDDRGHLVLDTDFLLNRVAFTKNVNSGASSSESVPALSGKKSVETAICVDPSAAYQSPHEVSRSGTTVSWSAHSESWVRCASVVFSFIYN
jgi:hypothetical protein